MGGRIIPAFMGGRIIPEFMGGRIIPEFMGGWCPNLTMAKFAPFACGLVVFRFMGAGIILPSMGVRYWAG